MASNACLLLLLLLLPAGLGLHNGRFPSSFSGASEGRSDTFDTDQSLFAPSEHSPLRPSESEPSVNCTPMALERQTPEEKFGARNLTGIRVV